MFPILLFYSILASETFASSTCPRREDIYPCSCHNVPVGKTQIATSVECHRLRSTDSLNKIFLSLRGMRMDSFHVYDSFWDAHDQEKDGEDKSVLPIDWVTLLKVKEFEIRDTTLSPCFACQTKLACRNTMTTKFRAVNSSSHAKICTSCKNIRGNDFPWTGCMSKLTQFQFSFGKLSKLERSLFSVKMRELTTLNLTHNEIASIEPETWRNLPKLKILDLSHNAIGYLEDIFSPKMKLEFLDVSWNVIQTLGDGFFDNLPFLKTFEATNNMMIDMVQSAWTDLPKNLKKINLRGNQLHCDCSIAWINETFNSSITLFAYCTSPDEYDGSLLRKTSRLIKESCDGASKKKTELSKPVKKG